MVGPQSFVVADVVPGLLRSAATLRGDNTTRDGQFGARRKRSAVDAVGTLVGWVEESWRKKEISGALCMDVAAAIPKRGKGMSHKKAEGNKGG